MQSQILIGDCLELMRAMPADSVDLVMCSPPYEAARTYGIDFKLRGQDWVDWMFARCVEMARVCKGLCVVVCEGQTRDFRYSCTPFLLMADLHRAGVNMRKPAIFHRIGIPGSGGPDWLRNDYEPCICFTRKRKLPWSDNTAMGHAPKWAPGGEMSHRVKDGSKVTKFGRHIGSRVGPRDAEGKSREWSDKVAVGAKLHTKAESDGSMREQAYFPPTLANPGNVVERTYTAYEVAAMLQEQSDVQKHLVGGGLMGSKLAHENEAAYPNSLPEFFIRSFCPEGGIVLDCFSGSGTTAAVADKWGRKYIAIDVRQSQVDLTKRRVKEVEKPLFTGDSA